MNIADKYTLNHIVSETETAEFVGSGGLPVYSTPAMIALMEKTCAQTVEPYLDEGGGTVGTLVNVTHSAATPVGMKVWCECELVEVDRRRLVFKVAAHDERGLIGEGTHERFIINKARFQAKVDSK